MESTKDNTPAITIWGKMQTYAIVTVVAVLIWLYSESENVKQQKPLQFTVQFVPSRGQQLLIIPNDRQPISTTSTSTRQSVVVTALCATSQYAELQRLQMQPVDLTVTEHTAGPIQIIDLRDMLQNSPIGELGVRLLDIQPRHVELRVERIEFVTLPISIDTVVTPDVQLATTPIIVPSEATVGLPLSMVHDIEGLSLEAKLESETVIRLEENIPHELQVTLSLPESFRQKIRFMTPEITPPAATVSITIRKQTDAIKLTGIPILLTAPWAELKRFSVEIEGSPSVLRDDIQLTGTSDAIESIREGQTKVWAELRLTADDLESGITSKQLKINIPPGVRVDSTIPRINFTIVTSSTPAPPPVPTP